MSDKTEVGVPAVPAMKNTAFVAGSAVADIPPEEQATQSPPPLPADRFGRAIGQIMHQFGIVELPVTTAAGTVVGTLRLSTASYTCHTLTAVSWERVEESEIQQTIYDVASRDLALPSGVFGSWDTKGLERLDAYRWEIMERLIAAVAATRQDKNAEDHRKIRSAPENFV